MPVIATNELMRFCQVHNTVILSNLIYMIDVTFIDSVSVGDAFIAHRDRNVVWTTWHEEM
jgi:hypothetical protein